MTFSLFSLEMVAQLPCSVTRLLLKVMGVFSLSWLGTLLALSSDFAFFCSDPLILKVKSECSPSALLPSVPNCAHT